MLQNLRLALVALTLLAAAACPDPGAGKPKAEVKDSPTPAADKAPAPSAPAGALTFSHDGSKIDFVGAKVTGKHDGGFQKFSGWVQVDGNMPKAVAVDIDMTSTWADNEKLAGHLKSDDFFKVGAHPKASFRSTKLEEGGDGGATHVVTGDLTLAGKTKQITFPVTVAMSDKAATVKSEFAINRKDFGIVYPGKPDDLIQDNVLIKLDINAPRAAK